VNYTRCRKTPLKSDHRIEVGINGRAWDRPLFFILFLTFAYFYQGGFDNINSRFDSSLSMAFRGSLAIDAFQANTVDKILHQGHYYSAKAPGAALLALPVALFFAAISDFETFFRSPWMPDLALYLATLLSVSLLSALSAVCFRRLLLLLNPALTLRQSVVFTLATYVGTLLLPYSTLMFGHSLAASFLVIATYLAFEQSLAEKPQRKRLALSAVCFGSAVLCEYPAVLLAVPLAAVIVWQSKNRRAALSVIHFALVPTVLLFITNTIAFGSPFALGQGMLVGTLTQGMDPGMFGLGWPSAGAALQLLFGAYRGLFFYCPVLLLALSGLVRLPAGRHRGLVLAGLSGSALLWIVNAGYPYWQGGVCFGPRHLVPIIPFIALGFAFMPLRRAFWMEFVVLGAVSLAINVVGTATSPFVDSYDSAPLLHTYPELARKGAVSINPMNFLAEVQENRPRWIHPELHSLASWNLGEKMGLKHWFSLLPLLVAWACFFNALRSPLLRRRRHDKVQRSIS
jgi:hypothetical protein